MNALMLSEHGFRNYAPFNWNKKQTGMKLDSYTSLFLLRCVFSVLVIVSCSQFSLNLTVISMGQPD